MILLSNAGAHTPNMAIIAGKVTPCIYVAFSWLANFTIGGTPTLRNPIMTLTVTNAQILM